MHEVHRALRDLDPQLILWFDNQRQRWVLLRQPIRYGSVPKYGYSDEEIRRRLRFGALVQVAVLDADGKPLQPGLWLVDRLKAYDTWRFRRPKDLALQVEQHEDYERTKTYERLFENLRYAILEDWKHIRDELRGDTIFRKWTQNVAVR